MSLPANEIQRSPDVIVVGGGVIGLSIAWELVRRGVSVRVLEQGQLGKESSWAGAGMLPPGNPEWAKSPEARLRAASHVLWPEWAEQLHSESGIDTGYVRCGGLEVRTACHQLELDNEIATWRAEGVAVESFDQMELHRRFLGLHSDLASGYWLPELGQVRNPRLLKSLIAACQSRGVDLRPGTPVVGLQRVADRIVSVQTFNETHSAAEVVVAGGAWSSDLLRRAGHEISIEPVRGQMVLLEKTPTPFRYVIQSGLRYLVPRADGRILVGSTEEHAGFEKRNTASGVSGLIEFACQLVPGLANARFEQCWSGLRPWATGGAPYIGRVQGMKNVLLAAGHFRSGLQLSPITA
ncbi:MAG: glycine oxidase ThiO, partial [Planctomycetes bacterium]|nr:glycine oxidase ThiO [Planctomycetota bacterium]